MPRVKASEIVKAGQKLTAVVPGGDDFLGRVNQTIKNFGDLIKMARDLQGIGVQKVQAGAPDTGGEIPYSQISGKSKAQDTGPAGPGGMTEFIGSLIAAGYGDTPIGKLIQDISPFTINQLLALVQSKGVKRAKSGK